MFLKPITRLTVWGRKQSQVKWQSPKRIILSLCNDAEIGRERVADGAFIVVGGCVSTCKRDVSELLGKATIDTNTYGKSTGHSGNYSTNYQNTGRELMTPDEVRMLDNRYAILFIRGERPILDEKFDILKHPNVGLTTDGNGKPYLHGAVDRAVASISLGDSLEDEFADDSLESEGYELLSDEDLEEIIQKYA